MIAYYAGNLFYFIRQRVGKDLSPSSLILMKYFSGSSSPWWAIDIEVWIVSAHHVVLLFEGNGTLINLN